MQPTLTHVPPRPHVVPAGDGLTKSQTATFLPSFAAFFEAASPPEPPPITCQEQTAAQPGRPRGAGAQAAEQLAGGRASAREPPSAPAGRSAAWPSHQPPSPGL
eukprot:3946469-Prymnesium_polylepis.1